MDENHVVINIVEIAAVGNDHGHPVTIYLNSQAVQLFNKANAKRYVMQESKLIELASRGGTILACPVCEKFLWF